MSSRRQTRTAAALLNATGKASADVIATRMMAFSNPATLLSPWHQSEARRMGEEKLNATSDGLLAASTEIALLPLRMMQMGMQPTTWSPTGWITAWQEAAGLWVGVGNAALRPARDTVVRNQARLAKKRR